MKPQTSNSLITSQIDPQRALKIPIAHGEGNYFAEADIIKSLNDNDQVLFRYCDAFGNITPDSNPNGSLDNIAGICNAERNVFGFMPHPERASDPLVANEDGLAIFESILSLVKA
jgi:phosphoribosylformylglycinamidine synthase